MMIAIPSPGEVVGLAKSTVDKAVGAAGSVVALPGRALGMVDDAEKLISRISEIVDKVDHLLERTSGTVDEVESVLAEVRAVADSSAETVARAARISESASDVVGTAQSVSDQAAETVRSARRTSETVDGLLAAYEPTAKRAAPMVEKFVAELSQKEVDAAIRLVDELPVLTEHVLSDILPILRTLDRVGPEIHELLEVTHDVRRAIVGIPGFRFFRRRGEDRVVAETGEEPIGEPPRDSTTDSSGGAESRDDVSR